MESSEDDAGTATSASRRASAREKDVGLVEDVDGTRNFQYETSEARTSCGTPAMSEDNFDGDSVPSPSTQNTSTEAILDMIDEIVDGPGAPKRLLNVSATTDDDLSERTATPTSESQHKSDVKSVDNQITIPPGELSPVPGCSSESLSESVPVQATEAECAPHSEVEICVPQSPSKGLTQDCLLENVVMSEDSTTKQLEGDNSKECVQLQTSLQQPVTASSSGVETLQSNSDTSDCENVGRTVKCMTSSENRDSVTVERAESTSSDYSVSESKAPTVEPVVRSPLKRRLVRPAPCDRRPDSTVSSTADSQTEFHSTEQTSESVAKDVSSSSDAVSTVHVNVKPEEISKVSVTSVCKAETSTPPARKIKLVRPKITPVMSNSANIVIQPCPVLLEKNQCESTSSHEISKPSSGELSIETTSSSTILVSEESKMDDSVISIRQPMLKKSTTEQSESQEISTVPISESTPQPTLEKTKKESSQCYVTDVQNTPEETKDKPNNELPISESSPQLNPETTKQELSIVLGNESISQSASEETEQEISTVLESVSTSQPTFEESENITQSTPDEIKHELCKAPESRSNSPSACHERKQELSSVSVTGSSHQAIEETKEQSTLLVYESTLQTTLDETKQTLSTVPESGMLQQVTEEAKSDLSIIPDKECALSQTSELMKSDKSNVSVNQFSEEIASDLKKAPVCDSALQQKLIEESNTIEPSEVTSQNASNELSVVNQSSCTETLPFDVQIETSDTIQNYMKPLKEEKKVPPIKLSLSGTKSESIVLNVNDMSVQSMMKCESLPNSLQDSVCKNINSEIEVKNCNEEKTQDSVEEHSKSDTKNSSKRVPPIKLNFNTVEHSKISESITQKPYEEESLCQKSEELTKQIPKLTIKLSNKHSEEPKSPVPKVTIKPIKPPVDENTDNYDQQIPSVTKINIKPIPKPDKVGIDMAKSFQQNDPFSTSEQVPNITKLNIKPILKPPEKVNEIHRKSSSSEISESEYSENDESTSTSDQASASDQGPSDTVPKVTIKLGKPGTECEGKFYTEKNVPKITIKNIPPAEKDDQESKLKLVISQKEDAQPEKIPKLTIKAVTKSDGQPLSPKLTIKPLKPPENINKDNEIPKLKLSTESNTTSAELKENLHIPKITIKPVTKPDAESTSKTLKKSNVACDSTDHIPVVTKLNIKPVLKPTETFGESSGCYEEKVPVVSKLNIKPVVKPKDNEVESSSIEDNVPKVIRLNIKPIKNPEESSSEDKDCDEMNDGIKDSIPVVTKLNIKPIIKPVDENLKDSENQSSETGTSSDENADHIPIVTKLNIKPIIKPSETGQESTKSEQNEQMMPVITKLNIKPLVKPEDSPAPSSPKKESLKASGSGIPVVTKLTIKPVIKPEETHNKTDEENSEKSTKNPPLVMVINMKNLSENSQDNEHLSNNISGKPHSPKISSSAKYLKTSKDTSDEISSKSSSSYKFDDGVNYDGSNRSSPSLLHIDGSKLMENACDNKSVVPETYEPSLKEQSLLKIATRATIPDITTQSTTVDSKMMQKNAVSVNAVSETNWFTEHLNSSSNAIENKTSPVSARHKKSIMQNCTLLKKLLSTTKEEVDKTPVLNQANCLSQTMNTESSLSNCNENKLNENDRNEKIISETSTDQLRRSSPKHDVRHSEAPKMRSIHDIRKEANESVTKPLEISTSDKIVNQVSGQDSPRIILKINKTDHGASSKIITEDFHKQIDSSPSNDTMVNEVPSPKKYMLNSRRKHPTQDSPSNITIGKRLRSSRIVENAEISPTKRSVNKRPSAAENPISPQNKGPEISILESKKMKLEQLLSANKSLTITPVISKNSQTSPDKQSIAFGQERKTGSHNHVLMNNENCPQKNGNSKLHNILSNLQAKQIQSLQLTETNAPERIDSIAPEVESNTTSTGSSDVIVEITRVDSCHPDVQEMLINENSVCDLTETEEVSQDPLEVINDKPVPEKVDEAAITPVIELTPQPRKRGRPRKQPLSEGAKPPPTPDSSPVPVQAPATDRPQRSLRLMRDKPAIISKPRGGRGRGRGGRRAASPETVTVVEVIEDRAPSPIDPTSSRIKLPRMTEALDKSVACTTPLSSRRRSSGTDIKLFGEPADVVETPVKAEESMKTPESRRGGRGSRGGRGRTPRGRGRGRGGGRGAVYMKETMGIYGRVCGPATTTVQLFEEETCMMDDNATPKPSHILDEDSQSSVKSSTNDSNKMKKSKFADLFDSNKVWTAADVKEYTWPPPDTPNAEPQVMMIQEQVAMFLGVKSFKRRYPELKRRTVGGDERDYVLSKGLVSEALCDLGITAVDACEVLDIMLSDYPHKYEEYRSHQRERQMTEHVEEKVEVKTEEVKVKVEVKQEKTSDKPEPPKVDPEKTRQDMAAAAIASASEWNARANALRRPACVDLQTMTVHRRRAPAAPPGAPRVRPPLGFYPLALLPGQYQHHYTAYTADQLRYFPLNTVLAAPPAPPSPVPSDSDSEGSWGERSSSSDDSDVPHHHSAKRKKLTKSKRSSQQEKEKEKEKEEPEGEVDTCRVCKLRLEANRKYTHERFLVCANCNAKLHPGCVDLSADTIRKCREYPWQCNECKCCCGCGQRTDLDKMIYCELCDRGFHLACVGMQKPPAGRWHCVECAICKSCGARDPGGLGAAGPGPPAAGPSTPGPSGPTPGPSGPTPGPAGPAPEWHHQTRRGPGGHKCYSHSLCTPCARAYRIGRYCPLCERSFIGPKGTMQLVICKLCDRQLHQECVKQTVSSLDVLHYTCGECRRGGITSRAAAVRAAPKTIASLFMAKRRFNKYAHRQYLQSRMRARDPPDAADTAPTSTDADDSHD